MRLVHSAPMLFVLSTCAVAGTIISVDNPFGQFGTVSNGTCANPAAPVCGAASMINSFIFLRNQYASISVSNIIPDSNTDGKIDTTDYNTARDNLAINGWADPANPNDPAKRRKGYYRRDGTTQSDWEAKVDWLNDFASGLIAFDGQIKTDKDVSTWKQGGVLENKYPEWVFIWNQIATGEDVEIAFFGTGVFHAVTLTGLEFEDTDMDGKLTAGEKRRIRFMDPNQNDKTQPSVADLIGDGADGQLRFRYSGSDVSILYAFSESPKDHTRTPEPAAGLLTALGLLWLFRAPANRTVSFAVHRIVRRSF